MKLNGAMSNHLTARAPVSGDADLLREWYPEDTWDRDITAEDILAVDSDNHISFVVEWKGTPISYQQYVIASDDCWLVSEYFTKQNNYDKINRRDYNYLKYNYPNLKYLVIRQDEATPAARMRLARQRYSSGNFEENGFLFIEVNNG